MSSGGLQNAKTQKEDTRKLNFTMVQLTSRPYVQLCAQGTGEGGDINLAHNGPLTRALRDIYPVTLGQAKVICMSVLIFWLISRQPC